MDVCDDAAKASNVVPHMVGKKCHQEEGRSVQ